MSGRPEAEEAAAPRRERRRRVRKPPSVMPYLAILAAAAFLLLVMAYFMQRRTAQSVEGLNQSMTALRSFDQLVEENRDLRGQVGRLQAELANAQAQRQDLEGQLETVQGQLADANDRDTVLTSFALLEQALRGNDYETAAAHVRLLCSGRYDLNLGIANNTESFSPAQRLAAIIPQLVRRGVLEQDEVQIP